MMMIEKGYFFLDLKKENGEDGDQREIVWHYHHVS